MLADYLDANSVVAPSRGGEPIQCIESTTMSLILSRTQVKEIYAEARERQWVLPTFNAENLTTVESILDAVYRHGLTLGIRNLPIIIGLTNTYDPRPQSVLFTTTKKWELGLRLFVKTVEVLASQDSPYKDLRVMIHLDHVQWDSDIRLLGWDMGQFSSVMYDASTLPLEENINRTADFVEKFHDTILIEGACDEISSAAGTHNDHLTTPEEAETYFRKTGVDVLVANLGTEHRASKASLRYEGALAREISKRIGPHLCLHGVSSVAESEIERFFNDGICKVNIWTALERDSAPVLLRAMIENAAKIAGPEQARAMRDEKLLGDGADVSSSRSIEYFTETFRRDIIFRQMTKTIQKYLVALYG